MTKLLDHNRSTQANDPLASATLNEVPVGVTNEANAFFNGTIETRVALALADDAWTTNRTEVLAGALRFVKESAECKEAFILESFYANKELHGAIIGALRNEASGAAWLEKRPWLAEPWRFVDEAPTVL